MNETLSVCSNRKYYLLNTLKKDVIDFLGNKVNKDYKNYEKNIAAF